MPINVSHLYIYKYVSYIGYGNTTWASTSQNKHKKYEAKTYCSNYISLRKRNLFKALSKCLSGNIVQILTFAHF